MPGYFKAVREVCDRHGVLLILDEVMCGMGRTGTLHACEQEGVVPDLLAIAKGLGGGYQPIGAVLAQRRIVDAMSAGTGFFQHGHTYLGHPVACAAALAVQQVIERDGLLERSARRGARLRGAGCASAFGDHPHVGDIRGRGLFWGIELVADRATKAPFDPALQLHARVKREAMARGLMVLPDGRHHRRPPGRPRPARAAVHRRAGRAAGNGRPAATGSRRGDRNGLTYASGQPFRPPVPEPFVRLPSFQPAGGFP